MPWPGPIPGPIGPQPIWVAQILSEGPDPEDLVDLRRTLYALHTVVRLNIAQEDQLYVSLDREATGTRL